MDKDKSKQAPTPQGNRHVSTAARTPSPPHTPATRGRAPGKARRPREQWTCGRRHDGGNRLPVPARGSSQASCAGKYPRRGHKTVICNVFERHCFWRKHRTHLRACWPLGTGGGETWSRPREAQHPGGSTEMQATGRKGQKRARSQNKEQRVTSLLPGNQVGSGQGAGSV